MIRRLWFAIIACAVVTGCAGKPASDFRPLSDVQHLAGTYENAPSAPGYGGSTLWKLLRPNHPKPPATPVEDKPTDHVSIELGPTSAATATLLRNGAVIDTQHVEFSRREDHLYRPSGGFVAK